MAATKFTKDSVVCFLGDSITANGGWIRRVYEQYRSSGISCKLYNCGVPGDSAEHALWRLEETVFCYAPTHVVVAFGMNDCAYTVYKNKPLTEKWVIYRRRRQDNCIHYLRLIAQQCKQRGAAVTFCTPTLPDEWMESETPVYLGVEAAILELSLRIRALAEELDASIVDLTLPFRRINHALNAQGKSLVCQDRIHPLPEGHELMAKVFLQAQGFAVTQPEAWEELQTLAAAPHDEWEEKRFALEQAANANLFAEWNFGFGLKSPEAIEAAIQVRLATEKNQSIRQRLERYAALRDQIPARRQALIDFTSTVKE